MTAYDILRFCAVRLLREELQLLQEQGSYVGEVVRAMDKKKVLVKVRDVCVCVRLGLLKRFSLRSALLSKLILCVVSFSTRL